jgi:hypothetical protein
MINDHVNVSYVTPTVNMYKSKGRAVLRSFGALGKNVIKSLMQPCVNHVWEGGSTGGEKNNGCTL